jgi:membrane protease YdiL (CAAX protease family)
MAVGSKSFPQDSINSATSTSQSVAIVGQARRTEKLAALGEILLVFLLLEAVLWTPRSLFHSLLIVGLVGFLVIYGFRGRTREQLGLVWPESGAGVILAIGLVLALAIPAAFALTGHPIPANPNWPRLRHIWPYVIWAVGQQFLLLSFLYVRFELVLGARAAVVASAALFTLAHLPNVPLTAMTLLGGLFFAEMFRAYRSIFPLAIVHALMGIAIAYSFPDQLMRHMRVGLSYWQFR